MRSAYALDTPRDQHWDTLAACQHNPDLWFTEGNKHSPSRLALHICATHCPVLWHCRAYAAGLPPGGRRSVILGGVGYNHAGRAMPTRGVEHCARCEVTP